MYFSDKSGISPDFKTSQEFTDFFFSVHVKRLLCSFGNLCLFLAENLLLPFWGYLCCFKGMMSTVLLITQPQKD